MVLTDAERARHLSHPQIECLGGLGLALEPHGPAVRQALARAARHHGRIQAVHIEHDAPAQLLALELRVHVRPPSSIGLADKLVLLGLDIREPLAEALAPSAHVAVVRERVAARRHLVQALIQELLHNHGCDEHIVVKVGNLLLREPVPDGSWGRVVDTALEDWQLISLCHLGNGERDNLERVHDTDTKGLTEIQVDAVHLIGIADNGGIGVRRCLGPIVHPRPPVALKPVHDERTIEREVVEIHVAGAVGMAPLDEPLHGRAALDMLSVSNLAGGCGPDSAIVHVGGCLEIRRVALANQRVLPPFIAVVTEYADFLPVHQVRQRVVDRVDILTCHLGQDIPIANHPHALRDD